MKIEPALQFRLAQAKAACIERMQDTADWLITADPADHETLRHCGHRLVGTLGSFGFGEAAHLAAALDRACEQGDEQVRSTVAALVSALRALPR